MLALLLLVQDPARVVVEGKGSPTATIPRLEASIVIDGTMDEPVWSQATRLTGFWQYQPVDGRPAEEQTEVLVWYAPDAIHFGIIAHDRNPSAIRATIADRDNIDNEDHIVIDLDTFHDRRRAFFFGVNPLGAQSDGVRSEGAGQVSSLIPGSVDKNPDFTWESKGRLTGRGYEIEIRISFKSLRYPGGGPQEWGFNVTRVVQRTGYTDTWTDVRRANASFLGQEGAIAGLHDLKRGVAVEAQPFVTATADGNRNSSTGAFDREDVDPDAGLNLRLGFTSYALDATINPDFSQVESDAYASRRPGRCFASSTSAATSLPARSFRGSKWSTSRTVRSFSAPSVSIAPSDEPRSSIHPVAPPCSCPAHRRAPPTSTASGWISSRRSSPPRAPSPFSVTAARSRPTRISTGPGFPASPTDSSSSSPTRSGREADRSLAA
ncbi:MAG TPA: hypothetical protein VIG08_13530 [Gemmatimonadales bacterium]|jgi:hypothetical protein